MKNYNQISNDRHIYVYISIYIHIIGKNNLLYFAC